MNTPGQDRPDHRPCLSCWRAWPHCLRPGGGRRQRRRPGRGAERHQPGFFVVLVESHDFAKGTSSRAPPSSCTAACATWLEQHRPGARALRRRTTLLRTMRRTWLPAAGPSSCPRYRAVGTPFLRRGPQMYDDAHSQPGRPSTRPNSSGAWIAYALPAYGARQGGSRAASSTSDGQFDDARLALA